MITNGEGVYIVNMRDCISAVRKNKKVYTQFSEWEEEDVRMLLIGEPSDYYDEKGAPYWRITGDSYVTAIMNFVIDASR